MFFYVRGGGFLNMSFVKANRMTLPNLNFLQRVTKLVRQDEIPSSF
jgi:hypothetical protein